MELLAPAGSWDALVAAARCHADAVYFGGQAFNARCNAANFDRDTLLRAVSYLKQRGKKAYLTLNTLVFDVEMDQAMNLVKLACAAGFDGVIVQDLGLAARIRAAAPGLCLHASTQLSVCSPAAARLLEGFGFSRVVLARELCLDEIAEIRAVTNMELEVFVHGALCMSVSGKCYASAMLGGRSGNRGLCAQPCRLPFRTPVRDYALSLKDLSLAQYIDALKNVGVDCLKIEGRMKRPEYVAAAVRAVRGAMDGQLDDSQLSQLQSVFSRQGFTDGYLTGRRGQDMFGFRTRKDVVAARDVLGELAALYQKEPPVVPVSARLVIRAESPMYLSVSDGVHTAMVTGAVPVEAARSAVDAERCVLQLCKTGGTPFFMDDVQCELDEGLAVSVAAVNQLRRDAFAQLIDLRGRAKEIAFADVYQTPAKKAHTRAEVWGVFHRPEGLPDQSSGLDMVFIPLFSDEKVLSAWAGQAGVIIPSGLFGREQAVLRQLERVKALGYTRALTGNPGGILPAMSLGFDVYGDFSLNHTNSLAFEQLGLQGAVVSAELKLTQIAGLRTGLKLGLYAYGHLPLMQMRNCPLSCESCSGHGQILDRRGEAFDVLCDQNCAYLLNPRPIWMADRLNEIKNVDFITLNFTVEDKNECEAVISAYAKGEKCAGLFTRGAYYEGVL